jgi:hypothetical protein
MPAQMSPLMRGALQDATRRLSGRFRGVFSEETVAKDWPVADPAGQPLELVRRTRYDIHHHVCELLDTLNIAIDTTLPAT